MTGAKAARKAAEAAECERIWQNLKSLMAGDDPENAYEYQRTLDGIRSLATKSALPEHVACEIAEVVRPLAGDGRCQTYAATVANYIRPHAAQRILAEEQQLWEALASNDCLPEDIQISLARYGNNQVTENLTDNWATGEAAIRILWGRLKIDNNYIAATPQTTQRHLLESPAWEYLLDNPNVSGETLTEIWEKLRHSSPAGGDTEDDILAHPNCPDRLAEEICDSAVEEARIDH